MVSLLMIKIEDFINMLNVCRESGAKYISFNNISFTDDIDISFYGPNNTFLLIRNENRREEF